MADDAPTDKAALREELRPLLKTACEALDRGAPGAEAFHHLVLMGTTKVARGQHIPIRDALLQALPVFYRSGASEDLMLNTIIETGFLVRDYFKKAHEVAEPKMYGNN